MANALGWPGFDSSGYREKGTYELKPMAVEYKGREISILGHLILMSALGEVWF